MEHINTTCFVHVAQHPLSYTREILSFFYNMCAGNGKRRYLYKATQLRNPSIRPLTLTCVSHMYIDMNILASAYFFGPPPLFDVYKVPVYRRRIGNDDDHKLKKSCFRSIKTGYLRALWHGRRMKANAAHIFIYAQCSLYMYIGIYVYLWRLKENLFDELLKSDWFNQNIYV